MKILHCADIHLDSAMTANLDKDKARERRSELLASFKDMVSARWSDKPFVQE